MRDEVERLRDILEAVWDAVFRDVPVLRSAVDGLLAQLEPGGADDPKDVAR